MKVITFLKKKNKLVKKVTGITLIPKEQIEKVTKHKLLGTSDADICPYCHVYTNTCDGCPMHTANNQCGIRDFDSTYMKVMAALPNSIDELIDIPGMKKLVKKYNKQFKN